MLMLEGLITLSLLLSLALIAPLLAAKFLDLGQVLGDLSRAIIMSSSGN